MTRRISLVAVCCSCASESSRFRVCRISAVAVCCCSASLRALVISAYDGGGEPIGLAVRGVPHSPQNLILGAFSCWHRGHRIPSVSRVRIVSACQGLRVTAPGSPKLGVPAAPGGTAARPYREPAPGASRRCWSARWRTRLPSASGVATRPAAPSGRWQSWSVGLGVSCYPSPGLPSLGLERPSAIASVTEVPDLSVTMLGKPRARRWVKSTRRGSKRARSRSGRLARRCERWRGT